MRFSNLAFSILEFSIEGKNVNIYMDTYSPLSAQLIQSFEMSPRPQLDIADQSYQYISILNAVFFENPLKDIAPPFKILS